jgi:hypothetical protein
MKLKEEKLRYDALKEGKTTPNPRAIMNGRKFVWL